jgi:hypothetical protein
MQKVIDQLAEKYTILLLEVEKEIHLLNSPLVKKKM